MRVGPPVVASDIEIFRETTGNTAIFVPNEPRNMVTAIREAINLSDEERSRMIERSLIYSSKRSVSRMTSIYESII